MRRGPLRLARKWRYAALLAAVLAALLTLIPSVGWVWFGWGYIADNKGILASLPAPPGVQRIYIGSHPYTGDESPITPPDGWGTLATYQAPHLSRDEIVDFYVANLSPGWRYCIDTISTFDPQTNESGEMMGNAIFLKGSALVSVDSLNLLYGGRGTFDIFVDHNRDFEPCRDDAPR